MIEAAATGRFVRRRRRVAEGEGMATPKRRVEVRYDGQLLVLHPGRSRLAPDHELVKARPDLFRAAWSKDEATRLQLEIAELRSRRRSRPRQAPPRGRPPGRVLPDRPPAPALRLP